MSEKKSKVYVVAVIIGVFVAVSILAVGFYWFSIRPSEIKKECSIVQLQQYSEEWVFETERYIEENCQNTIEKSTECLVSESMLRSHKRGQRPARDDEYEQCLRQHGL